MIEKPTDSVGAALYECAKFLHEMCAPRCSTCKEDRLAALHGAEMALGAECWCDLVRANFSPSTLLALTSEQPSGKDA